jgi:small GTP-binding protein
MSASTDRKKLVVVGDGACGKTCLLIRFAEERFEPDYIPTIFENRAKEISVDGKPIDLTLWDTAGQEAYDQIRPLAYNNANVALICYSVDSPASLHNVTENWITEISHYCPKTPVLLIGNKLDLASDTLQTVTKAQGDEVAEKIKAVAHIQCSALNDENVQLVFERAAKEAVLGDSDKPKRGGCCIVM